MTIPCETLVIGAGLIGSSVAMHLAKLGMPGVRCVDLDLEGSHSSSELNAGGVRATWNQPINIELSRLTIDYLTQHAAAVGYRPVGYLWLQSPERMPLALKARERQQAQGWEVQAWDLPELRRRVPFIDKTEGVAGATFAPRDGLVNPNLLKNHFRAEAKGKSAAFDDRTWIVAAEHAPNGARRWLVKALRFERALEAEERIALYAGRAPDVAHVELSYEASQVVNCAGPWAVRVAEILGYGSPVYPMRRQICLFDCRGVDLTRYGMVVDTSGVYFHPEATYGLAGFASHGEPRGVNFSYDGESFFMEVIWPALYERSSAFEQLRHRSGWAGLYEVSPDESAVIGLVESGETGRAGGVYEAHSFSGHGVMHSYSAGRALAERMIRGRYETVDLAPLSARRFETGRLVREDLVI